MNQVVEAATTIYGAKKVSNSSFNIVAQVQGVVLKDLKDKQKKKDGNLEAILLAIDTV